MKDTVTMKLIITIVLLFLGQISVFAQMIDVDKVRSLFPSLIGNKDYFLSKSTETCCILSAKDSTGYVILVKDGNDSFSVIGYSDSGVWDEKVLPPTLIQWIDNLKNRQSSLHKNMTHNRSANERKEIPFLMKSRWHQGSPYNDMCPFIIDGNIKTAAGCVAIAASQVVYYWRNDNPQSTSEDTPTYPYGKAPVTYSVPVGTEYQWELMKDYYSLNESLEEKAAVARLVYIMGTSTYLQYGTSTGGQITDIVSPFSKQFRLNAKFASKKNYSQEEWEQLIYSNLIKKQPVVYAGSTGDYAHAVVIDGYNSDLNLFHFNFGWGGDGDGYYTIDDVSGMNGYTLGQECICDIYPRQKNMSIALNVVDSLYVNTQGRIEIAVRNGSTLDINDLYLFVSKAFISPTDKDKAVWHYDGQLKNDDSEYQFTLYYTPSFSGSRVNLILTDGEMNILAQKSIIIQESSGIHDVIAADNPDEELYSIKGEQLAEKPRTGIYIVRNKNGKSKIIITQ